MALSDPQTITINEVETKLPRVTTGNFSSTYESSDGNTILKLSTAENGKRKRQVVRVDIKKITEDPFIPAQNREVSMSTYIVTDRPLVGFSNKEALDILVGLLTLSTGSEDNLLVKLLGGES